MKPRIFLTVMAFACASFVYSLGAQTERHRATRLGNPATRFTPPLETVDDLRSRFGDLSLRPDFADILRQWGWPGKLDDFFAAGLTNDISEWQIAVGETMPFMSSREAGRPVCLRNVTWAGTAPIPAYAFVFHSNGRVWRCVTPKPCGNFFIEDLGPEPRHGLAIDCETPNKVIVGRTVEVRLRLGNTGNVPEPRATVVLTVPDGATLTSVTDDGIALNKFVRWIVSDLPTNATRQVRAVLKTQKTGRLNFEVTAGSAAVAPMHGGCETEVVGVPAILLEKSDDPDPVAVGDPTTYTVKITNQGTADDANVQLVVTIAPELTPVSSAEGRIDGQIVTLPLIPKLAPGTAVTYEILAKGVSLGDGHTKFTLTSDMLKSPLVAEESTTVY